MYVHVCTAQVSVLYVLRTDTRTHVTARNVKELQRNSLCNCNSTVSPIHFYLIFIHHGGKFFSPRSSTQNGNWWWFQGGLEYSIHLRLVKRHFTKSNALTGPDDQFEHHPPPSFPHPPPSSTILPLSSLPLFALSPHPLIPSFSIPPSLHPSLHPSIPPALQPSNPPALQPPPPPILRVPLPSSIPTTDPLYHYSVLVSVRLTLISPIPYPYSQLPPRSPPQSPSVHPPSRAYLLTVQ